MFRSEGAMTVLSVAYPLAAVEPASVGGAEQVLATVEAGMAARGVRSVVVAQAGSRVAGTLLTTPRTEGVLTEETRAEVEAAHQANLDRALGSFPVSLVHMHGIDFHRYHVPVDVPVLVTLHLPPTWYPEAIWRLPPNFHLQCVSEAQRLACPAEVRERLPVVENGVPLPPEYTGRKRGFALVLSRVCPEKNVHVALDAARLAGVPVLLAGQVFPYPEHMRYFEEEIRPRLGGGVRLIGPVGGMVKQRLLAAARCLLLPTLAPETSSLVAMEALAAGTPVVTFPSGAIPAIVEEGRTGFLVSDMCSMAAAIGRVGSISSEECRAVARERFSAERMVREYLGMYAALAS